MREATQVKQMNALTGAEFFRLTARMGGLWNVGSLSGVCGDHARAWPKAPGFPQAAWKVGRTRLWAGWEVWAWLEDTKRIDAANRMYLELGQLRKTTRTEVIG